MQQTLFRLRQAWNPLSLVFSLADPVINPSLPSRLFEMRLPERNARKCHNSNWAVSVWLVHSVWKCATVGQEKEKKFDMKKRPWAPDNAPYQRILSRWPGCRGRGLVCSSEQPPLQHCSQTLHDVVTGQVNLSQTLQTDVMRPVLISCRHLHDFMQTEHYTGINYCYKNNQVLRVIRNWGPSSCIRQQLYILNQCRHKCHSAPDNPWSPRPWCLTSECLSPISLWSRVRQTAPAKSAQPWPRLSRSKKVVSCKS